MCFFILFKWWLFSKRILFYLRREKKKERRENDKEMHLWEKKKKKVWSCPWAPQFSTFYKKVIQECCYLKTKYWYGWVFKIYVLNTLKHVTQTSIINYRYQICFFFFNSQFSVFKHWKLLFEHCDQTSFRLSIYVINYVALI